MKMRKFTEMILVVAGILVYPFISSNALIIIDHSSVGEYDNIPQEYIDEVKKMNFHYHGASHGSQMQKGLELLQEMDSNYAFQYTENVNNLFPQNAVKELDGSGHEDEYWRGTTGTNTLKNLMLTAEGLGYKMSSSFFGWSYHICNDGYHGAFREADIQEYIDAITMLNNDEEVNETRFVYHTSIMDGGQNWDCYPERDRYNDMIRQAAIDNNGVLFDQADIEQWNHDNTDFRPLRRHTDYDEGASGYGPDTKTSDHTNDELEIRKAKAMWVLLAKLAGWDGGVNDEYTLDIGVIGNGSVTKMPDQAAYSPGESVTLQALPGQGYEFSSWSGSVSGNTNPTTIMMDSNKYVTATFVQPAVFTLNININGGGSVTKNPDKAWYTSGEVMQIEAFPAQDYIFYSWSGSLTGNFNPVNITMDSDKIVTANFAPLNTNTTNQITQFGITWTFDGEYPFGQFANGDYWVVGPVTIVNIDPPSSEINGRTMNGSMINPSPTLGDEQGYDSALHDSISSIPTQYNPALNKALNVSVSSPVVIQPHSSLVSTISIEEINRPQIRAAAILTVLDSIPPEGSFRPPYCGTDKTIRFNKSQLNYPVLARLPIIQEIHDLFPTFQYPFDNAAEFIKRIGLYFERPWIDHIPSWHVRYLHPSENMPDYSREMAKQVGDAALALNLDFSDSEKEATLVRFVQLGIDNYGVIQDGGKDNWIPLEGQCMSRKLPIVFAGKVLGDEDMLNIGTWFDNNNTGVVFQEDLNVFYVSQENDVDRYVRGVNKGYPPAVIGSDSNEYRCIRTHTASADNYPVTGSNWQNYWEYTWKSGRWLVEWQEGTYYEVNDGGIAKQYTSDYVGLPEWGSRHYGPYSWVNSDDSDWFANYRHICATGMAGHALVIHIMGLKEAWDRDVFLDYQDRWYYHEENEEDGVPPSESRQSLTRLTKIVWDTYRLNYPPVWTPGINRAPVAVISADPVSGEVPLTVNFDGSESSDSDGSITNYSWDFGDGSSAQGVSVTHTFDSEGEYVVTLTVTDNANATGETQVTITVSGIESQAEGDEVQETKLKCYNNVIEPSGGGGAAEIHVDIKDRGHVSVVLYDSKGREIKKFANETKDAGSYTYYWYGKDDSGNTVGSGVYLVQMKSGSYSKTKKIAVIK